jgi:hypothetical protein
MSFKEVKNLLHINHKCWVPLLEFFVAMKKMPEKNNLLEKDLFWFMISEDSVHSSLASCTWEEYYVMGMCDTNASLPHG